MEQNQLLQTVTTPSIAVTTAVSPQDIVVATSPLVDNAELIPTTANSSAIGNQTGVKNDNQPV